MAHNENDSRMTAQQEFELLVSQYYSTLYQFAFSLARNEDDACDLTQQTYYTWARKGHQLRDRSKVKTKDVDANLVRCPDPAAAKKMTKLIDEVRAEGDSLGGIIECVVRNVPAGLGEPVFDKLEADLAKAMLSLPATKGFEVGSGFAAVTMRGSEHNDPFEMHAGKIRTSTNYSGGIQGGISNGEAIYFRVALKPTATIGREQKTVTKSREETRLTARGRHDPCVLPRAVPIVEAMTALVLCDHALRQRAIDPGKRAR